LAELGCDVIDADPDLAGVDEIFQTLRAAGYARRLRGDLERHRAELKDTVIWNIERGLALTPADVERATQRKLELERCVDRFLERYDFLVLPVVQVAPFPVEIEWIGEIEGVHMETYIDWMATCYAISCTGLPAISVPCGFTNEGLPVGLQIVGRRRRDRDVLELAHAFERRTRFGERRPAIAV
jgi:amidase